MVPSKSKERARKAAARRSLGKIAAGIKAGGQDKINRIARLTKTPVKAIKALVE